MSFLYQLNPQQREAVETTDGPVLILAGAGSGKTRVITYRIAHLIENLGVMPESILAMTFTNKAAAEMVERVEKLVGGLSIAKPVISTFHSFCVRAVAPRHRGPAHSFAGSRQPPSATPKSFVIYDESDQQQVAKGDHAAAGHRRQADHAARRARARFPGPRITCSIRRKSICNPADPKTERVAQIYAEYRKELAQGERTRFRDLLLEVGAPAKVRSEVREYYNRRFQYIWSTNIRTPTVRNMNSCGCWRATRHNVCAVGDEDQSIYSWRGADIRNILEFEKDFPEAKIVRLEQNYRSTQNILQAASAVVANNIKRKGKNLWTARQGGSKIGYYEAPDGENEALFAADTIAQISAAGGRARRDSAGGGPLPHQFAIAIV